jgi:NAD(P)-dependent dehydrogenase (short-subunit alcohol dehydrogenase family)
MSKDKISSSYMEKQKKLHNSKELSMFRTVFMTGTKPENNIGGTIKKHLTKREGHFGRSQIKEVRDPVREIRKDLSAYNMEGCDVLISCHAINHMDWIENQSDKNIREQIDVNLTGTIRLVQEFVAQTINSKVRKKIIMIGSMAYKAVLNASAPYCASKAGLAHFTKCIAWELAPKGYDVYCIHPSNVLDSPMSEATIKGIMRYRKVSRAEAEAYWGAVCPKNSFLTKGEIADLVEYLLFSKTEYLSGANIELAGGQR